MLRTPPDILITTPESLYLLLTSQAREQLRSVETLILDEVHAVAGTKRGAHLALSVERLERLVEGPLQRIGLSATQRPLEEIGRFVSGGRPIQLVDAGSRKELDLRVVVPVEDMRELASTAGLSTPVLADGVEMGPGVERSSQSIWPSIYPEILREVEAHRSTIVFVNNRRLAERLALRLNELAGRELAPRSPRLARARAAGRGRGAAEARRDPVPRRDLVARARDRHGRRRPRDPGRVAEVGRARAAADRARRARARRRLERAHLPEVPRATCSSRPSSPSGCAEGAIEETVIPRNPLDVLAQQIVAICADEEISVDDLLRPRPPRLPVRRPLARPARERARHARRPLPVRRVRGAPAAHRLGPHRRRRPRTPGVRRLAVTNAGTIPDRGLFGVFLVDGGGRVGELDEEMVYEARAGQMFLLGASTWRIEEITRDRVLVSPAPGVPGARCRSGRARGSGGPTSWARRSAAPRASSSRSPTRRRSSGLTSAPLPRRARRRQPAHLPPRAGGRDRRRPVRPHRRRRALPRRDRRLARLHPHARSARACTRRGRSRSPRGCATRSGSRCSRSGRTTGSRSTSPTPTRRRRRPTWRSPPTRSRSSSCRRWGRPRSSARASARTRPARC